MGIDYNYDEGLNRLGERVLVHNRLYIKRFIQTTLPENLFQAYLRGNQITFADCHLAT